MIESGKIVAAGLACVCLLAGAALLPAASPPAGVVVDQQDPAGGDPGQIYNQWIDDKIAALGGDSEAEQRKAADLLGWTIPTAAARIKVLEALEPHLNGGDKDFRLRCVQAYGHWATADQTKALLTVVATPTSPRTMSGDEPCWAAATAALVYINPKAAQSAVDKRVTAFFFRTSLSPRLAAIALENSPAQPIALALQKRVDGSNPIPFVEAVKLLASDSASDRGKGAKALSSLPVTAADQSRVLSLLKSHVMGKDGRARLPFVEAYAHWARPQEVPTLQAIVGFPEHVEGLTGQENCWAAATIGLARFAPQAARQAVSDRGDSLFYRSSLHGYLMPLAQGNGPMQPVACWLLGELESGAEHPPLPPGITPDQMSSPPQAPHINPNSSSPRA